MKKGDVLERVTIHSLGRGGVGIAKAPDGKKILIKGALPDSVVDIKIVQRKRSYLTAHITQVHSVDKKRVDTEVPCPHYFFPYAKRPSPQPPLLSKGLGLPLVAEGEGLSPAKKDDVDRGQLDIHRDPTIGCGGCKWQVMSYPKQLELKQDMLVQCFHSLDVEVLPILGTPKAFGYRNKIEFSFGKYLVRNTNHNPEDATSQEPYFSLAEHWQLGFHKQGEFSKVVDIDQCYLVSESMHTVYAYIKEQLQQSGLPVYDAKSHTGVLRHLVLREGVHTGHIMVNISYASANLAEKKERKIAWEKMLKTWKQDSFLQEHVTTFLLTENNGLADVVRGQNIQQIILWGTGKIFEELHMHGEDDTAHVPSLQGEQSDGATSTVARFQISPFSFFQTNTWGAEVLFGAALSLLGEVQGNIIDLYCGSGTIGLTMLKLGLGKSLKGIDIVESAVYDATENAKINSLQERATFYCGKAEQLLGSGAEEHLSFENFLIGKDVVVIDPPREGLHPKVVDFLISLKLEASFRLLYISCNPTTMARDIALLQQGGYMSTSIQPVDMFPQTHHIECISLLI